MTRTATAPHWVTLDDVPADLGRTVVVLGVFDGLHRGHAHLLHRARALATDHDVALVLVTFDPHPAIVAGRARDTSAIVSVDQRVRLAHRHGVDHVLVLRFDACLAAVPPDEFVRTVLVERLGAIGVVVGENFRFGRGGRGDVERLHQLGAELGFTAHGIELLPGCSSTQIRSLVTAGDLPEASRILGRCYRIEGRVVNDHIDFDHDQLLPPAGRYHARVDDQDTVVTIRPDRSAWIHDHVDGPITVGLVRAV